MRSSLNILAALAIASSTVSANAFPAPESFDLSNLNARAALPAVVGSAASAPMRRSDLTKQAARRAVENGAFDAFMLSKRGEAAGPEDCGDDEEWVEVWVEDDGSQEEAQPQPEAEAAPAPAPAPAPAKEEQKQEEIAPEIAPVPLPSPVAVTIPGDLTTPENM